MCKVTNKKCRRNYGTLKEGLMECKGPTNQKPSRKRSDIGGLLTKYPANGSAKSLAAEKAMDRRGLFCSIVNSNILGRRALLEIRKPPNIIMIVH